MKAAILSSGSRGNSVLIQTDNTKILIDLGVTKSYAEEKLKELEWYRIRLDACNACEFNSKYHKKEIKKSKTERAIYLLNQKKNYCMICKCAIEDKASEELEECSNKENKKWESIQL